jgi:DNA-binding CsgD family transcriptional regulator
MSVKQPQLLLTGTLNTDSQVVLRCGRAYAGAYHVHDPLFASMRSTSTEEQPVVGHLLAEDIEFAPYRNDIYLANGLIERLSTLYWDRRGVPVQFSLYRQREQGYFKDREIDAFLQMSPALLQLIKGHLALCREDAASNPWQHRLREREPALTVQEVEVCAGLLQGMTHAGIAAHLGLKESTIKTYRNRAFDRLGIHFRNELFALFAQD